MPDRVGLKTKSMARKIEKLPPEARQKVEEFVNSLSAPKRARARFKFDWQGALAHLAKKHSAVELQHRTSRWWTV